MRIALSPYHLSTREAPAMASALLARHVYTLMPMPFSGSAHAQIAQACRRVPRYAALLESWSWSTPLWQAGVIASAIEDDDAIEDVRDAVDDITSRAEWEPIAHLVDPRVFADERAYLGALSYDILRGGPDPGITIPITAGLDRFAARRELIAARPEPASAVQRAEAKLAQRLARVALPVLIQAPAEAVLAARDALQHVLDPVRESVEWLTLGRPGAEETLRAAASEYAAAFDAYFDSLRPDADDLQIRRATLALTFVSLPVSAALLASRSAVARARVPVPAPDGEPDERFICCLFKQIGRPAAARHARAR